MLGSRFAIRRVALTARAPVVRRVRNPVAVARSFSAATTAPSAAELESTQARYRIVQENLLKSLTPEEEAFLNDVAAKQRDSAAFDAKVLDTPSTITAKIKQAFKDDFAKFPVDRPDVPDEVQDKFLEDAKKRVSTDPATAYGTPKAGAIGMPGIFTNYGLAATLGFLGVIGISKEFLILNEEILVAVATIGVLGAGWVSQADSIHSTISKSRHTARYEIEQAMDITADMLRAHLAVLKNSLGHVQDQRELSQHYKNVLINHQKSRVYVARKQVLEAAEKELQEAVEKEDAQFEEFVNANNDAVLEFVEAEVKKDPQLRAAFFRSSLEAVSSIGQTGKSTSDPLNVLYEKYFSKKGDELKRLKAVYDDLAERVPKMTDAEFAAELKKHDAKLHPTIQGLRKQFKIEPLVISPAHSNDSMSAAEVESLRKYYDAQPQPAPFFVQWRPHGLL